MSNKEKWQKLEYVVVSNENRHNMNILKYSLGKLFCRPNLFFTSTVFTLFFDSIT